MIDVTTIPERFKDSICETEHHDVLNGFFTQVVIDAIDLLFPKNSQHFPIECARRFQIATWTPGNRGLAYRLPSR